LKKPLEDVLLPEQAGFRLNGFQDLKIKVSNQKAQDLLRMA
jgi:hypothetical protein